MCSEYQPLSGYIAYDALLTVESNGEEMLNLTTLRSSTEPSSCSGGDEEYALSTDRVALSHLFATCTANMSLTAKVAQSSFKHVEIMIKNSMPLSDSRL